MDNRENQDEQSRLGQRGETGSGGQQQPAVANTGKTDEQVSKDLYTPHTEEGNKKNEGGDTGSSYGTAGGFGEDKDDYAG